MRDKIFCGVDPDLHSLSLVAIDDECNLVGVWMVKKKGSKGSEAVKAMVTDGLKELFSEGKGLDILHNTVAFAVEGQNVTYTAGTGANPQDIVDLSAVAGAVMAILNIATGIESDNGEVHSFFPKPSAWKGTVPKHVVQYRALRKVNLEYSRKVTKSYQYPIPDREGWDHANYGPSKINDGDWRDVADSVGLALYAREQWYKKNKIKKK